MHLIREFAPDAYEFALSSWSWIGTGGKTPRFASCFGDMFLEAQDGWWFLDTVEGTLERRWSTMDDMFADLEGEDGRAEYLLEETLNAALDQGLRLGDDEVFAFLPPPAVTGTMSVNSLAPLRFAIAANLAGRIHGELNGVQPDAGASALFAAHAFASQGTQAQSAPAQNVPALNVSGPGLAGTTPSFDSPNPPADLWQPAAQQVNTGAYPSYQPAADAGQQPAYQAGYQPEYAAGSELDYGSGQQGYGAYAPTPAAGVQQAAYGALAGSGAHAAIPPAPAPAAAPGGYGPQGGHNGYDFEDNAHTLDSSQFSQYIADQYNTGQMSAVEHDASAPAQQRPRQDGRWSYA
ncbi:hypothetical protein GCM10010413_33540 [Promicromonospora sukumoe]|uniref:T6SS immunity protein Tdi1 C-terminal domain-containing protein n=1 Tax=Promicromonospora sukumoe TaxID=88382 RepID=A0A7W3PDS5_9MICO|nr:hypothetical protein [Promicromonospora sukumoe]MBA8808108.1 hypothetical protein [Promicromonospora sukumoe]